MDKTTERIKADAEAYAEKENSAYVNDYNGYIAGATAENKRAQPAIDTLEQIANSPVPANVREMAEWIATARMLAISALEQWKGTEQFTGSTFTSPAPGITLGCISPEARELLDTIMEAWEAHYKTVKTDTYEPTFYGFAYWLVRWSGLIQPTNTNQQNKSK